MVFCKMTKDFFVQFDEFDLYTSGHMNAARHPVYMFNTLNAVMVTGYSDLVTYKR